MSIRSDLLAIIGFAGEFCEPNSKPVKAFYTDRYLSPVLDRLVGYIERREAVVREDYGDHMYDVGYQRGVDDTRNRLSGPVPLSETDPRLIQYLNLLADEYGLAGVASTAYQMKRQSIVPASRIAESYAFIRGMEHDVQEK